MRLCNGFDVDDLHDAVANTGDALDGLNNARLLLTGGTGFFGQWILATLIHANRTRGLGAKIDVVTRAPQAFAIACPDLASDPAVHCIAGDVRSLAIDRGTYTHVIHAATDTSVAANSKALELVDTIVQGTRNLLDIALASGAREFLYLSSGAVYGGQNTIEHVDERYTGACNPMDYRSAYAEGKRMAELLCTLYGTERGLRTRVARCFAFVGPGMPLDAHFAIGNFISDSVSGRKIVIKGDGTPLRSYLYAGDNAAWLLRTLVLGRPNRAYNVGSDHAVSIRDLAKCVADAVPGSDGAVILGTPSGDLRSRYVPSIELARRDIGAQVWTPLPMAIAKTAAWARRKHQSGEGQLTTP